MNNLIITETLSPTLVEDACRLLAQAKTIDYAKQLRDQAKAIAAYARDRGASDEAVSYAVEAKLWAERRIGELSAALPKTQGARKDQLTDTVSVSSKKEALEAQGVTQKQASRWEQLARMSEGEFSDYVDRRVGRIKHTAESTVAANSIQDIDGDEWYTPKIVINHAMAVMGGIDLDPASCAAAAANVCASRFFTKKDDGLSKPWRGRVWCNPPYSTPAIERFTEKFIAEIDAGNVTEAFYLVNNCTDTKWFHSLLRFPLLLFAGRLKFWRENHKSFAARQGQVLFYHGPNFLRFKTVFGGSGKILVAA